jgi:tape measure domain-containing protein
MVVRSLLTLLGYRADDKALNRYGAALKQVVNFLKIAAIATAALGGAVLKMAGDMEQVEIAFETMLGSATKAEELLKDITQFAAVTPFELTGLIQSSKQLLAFKFSAEEIIPIMRNLGNIAAGVGRDKLPTLVRALGKIRVKGKATMEELNMLLEAGVPILDQLAANLGVTSEELFKMITKGEVAFQDVNKALADLSTGTGMFANLMEKQSKSFLGIISNIGDVITQIGIAIGKDLLPFAKEMAKEFLSFLEVNKDIIKTGIVAFIKGLMLAIAFVGVFIGKLVERLGGLNNIMNLIGDVIGFVIKIIVYLAKIIFRAVGRIIKSVKSFSDEFKFAGEVIGGVLSMFIWWIGKVIDFIGWWIDLAVNLVGWILRIARALTDLIGLENIKEFFVGIAEAIDEVWSGLPQFFADIWKKITQFFLDAWEGIVYILTTVPKKVIEWLKGVWNSFADFMGTLWDNIVAGIKTAWTGLIDGLTGLWEDFMKFIQPLIDTVKGVIEFFMGGPSPELTMAGTTAGTTTGGSTTTTVNSTVNMTVPPGTPEEQARFVEEQSRKAVQMEWESILKEGIVNNPGRGF